MAQSQFASRTSNLMALTVIPISCALPYFICTIVITTTAPCWCWSAVNWCPIVTPWPKESGNSPVLSYVVALHVMPAWAVKLCLQSCHF